MSYSATEGWPTLCAEREVHNGAGCRRDAGQPEVGLVISLDAGPAGTHSNYSRAKLHLDFVAEWLKGLGVEFEGVRERVLGDTQAEVIKRHLGWI